MDGCTNYNHALSITTHNNCDSLIVCEKCRHIHNKGDDYCINRVCPNACDKDHTKEYANWSAAGKSLTEMSSYCSECKHFHNPKYAHRGGYIPASANECALCGAKHDWSQVDSGLNAMAWKTVAVVYAGIFEIGKADPTDAVGAGLSLENILLLAPDDVFASLFRDTGAVYHAISIYGTLLVVVYFLLEIAETNLNGGFTYETFAKLCVQTIFMFLFIRNGMDFIEYGASVCGDILMTLQRTPDGSTPPFSPSECPYHDAIASGWIPGLTQAGMVLKYGIPYMVALISYCILQIIIWGRVLDIAIRIMFAPIAITTNLMCRSNIPAGWTCP